MQQVDNNEGLDYKLKLVDAPTEDEIENRRAREFEAAEHDRLLQIAEAEAEISKEVGAEREDAEGDAMHDWWRVRRADLRQHAINMVQQELGGSGEGCADSLDVRSAPSHVLMLGLITVSVVHLHISLFLHRACCVVLPCSKIHEYKSSLSM